MRDIWIKDTGWIFELQDDQRRLSYHYPESGRDIPSDYCELWLIKALVEDWVGGAHLLLDPITGDQTAFCCVMPREVYDALCQTPLLDPEEEEVFEPSPTRLVLQTGWSVEEYFESIVRLTPDEADAMIATAPADWLSEL